MIDIVFSVGIKALHPEAKGEYIGPTGYHYPEFFGPDDFEIGKKYRIGSKKYKRENEIEWRVGIVTQTNVVAINCAKALEMVVEEEWKGRTRKVRRTYSYYKMREVELIK